MYSLFNKILILFIILFLPYISFSQKKYKEEDWADTTPTVSIPDSLQKLDAIMIYQKQEIIIGSNNLSSEIIRRRIKILTIQGLDYFTSILIVKEKKQKIIKLDARTIKASGKIVDLDNEAIKKVDIIFDENDRPDYEMVKFALPDVEVGDEIEYVYSLGNDEVIKGKDIFLFSYLPSLRSEFSIRARTGGFINFLLGNGMPEPHREVNGDETIYKIIAENVPAIGIQEYRSNVEREYPFLSFAVRYVYAYNTTVNVNPDSWPKMYDYYVSKKIGKNFMKKYQGKTVTDFCTQWIKQHEKEDDDMKLYYFTKFVNDSMEIVKMDDKENNLPGMFYIVYKRIDDNNLFALYKTMFDVMGVNYMLGLARNKYGGIISTNVPSVHQITDIFFVIENKDKQLHYIYPSNADIKYNMDEIPYYALGTKGIIVKRFSPTSDKYYHKEFEFASIPATDNVDHKKISVQFNSSDKTASAIFSERLSGDFSTSTRHFLKQSLKEENSTENFKKIIKQQSEKIELIDSIYITNEESFYPFSYTLNYKANLKNNIIKLNTNTYNIPLQSLLEHYTIESDARPRYTGYIVPFMFTSKVTIELHFDKKVDALSKDIEYISEQNTVGDYSFSITKKDPQTLIIQSELKVSRDRIHPLNYPDLHALNNYYLFTKNKNLIVKLY
jgi:hypothetical protein